MHNQTDKCGMTLDMGSDSVRVLVSVGRFFIFITFRHRHIAKSY